MCLFFLREFAVLRTFNDERKKEVFLNISLLFLIYFQREKRMDGEKNQTRASTIRTCFGMSRVNTRMKFSYRPSSTFFSSLLSPHTIHTESRQPKLTQKSPNSYMQSRDMSLHGAESTKTDERSAYENRIRQTVFVQQLETLWCWIPHKSQYSYVNVCEWSSVWEFSGHFSAARLTVCFDFAIQQRAFDRRERRRLRALSQSQHDKRDAIAWHQWREK